MLIDIWGKRYVTSMYDDMYDVYDKAYIFPENFFLGIHSKLSPFAENYY